MTVDIDEGKKAEEQSGFADKLVPTDNHPTGVGQMATPPGGAGDR